MNKRESEGYTIVNIDYYKTENGECPVMDFLQKLPSKLRSKSLRDIDLLEEFGYDLREPHVKPIQGIYELRVKFASDIARIFYFTFVNDTFVLLHGFKKKTLKTPQREIDIALRRKEDYIRRNGE